MNKCTFRKYKKAIKIRDDQKDVYKKQEKVIMNGIKSYR